MSITAAERGATPSASTRAQRSPAVHGIRGLCALALVFTHVALLAGLIGTKEVPGSNGPSNMLGGFFASGLQIAAGVFFLLTGLFIYRPYAKSVIMGTPRPDRGRNFVRRALRLLPAYYVMYVVVLFALNFKSIDSVWYVLRPILLFQVYDHEWVNGMEVTWTVPAMAQWYLALPVIAWATHRFAANGTTPLIRARRLMLPVPILIGVGFAWLFFVKSQDMGTRALFWWPMGLAPNIGIGMGLAILLVLGQATKQRPALFRAAAAHPNLFLLGGLVALLINCARPFSEVGMDDIYSLSGLLVFYVLNPLFAVLVTLPIIAPDTRSRFVDTVFANRPVVYLGQISYGVYLWHFAVMHFYLQGDQIFGGQLQPILALRGTAGFLELELAVIAGSVLIASISYYLLERPVMAWGERYLERRDLRRAAARVHGEQRPVRA